MTAPVTPKVLPSAQASDNTFGIDKSVAGNITVLSMHGTLDHAFVGKKVADSVKTGKLVVSMRDVKRLASWGMSEWMEFLKLNQTRDVYLVECSTYAVSQLNLVTGLLGHAKLVSFHASFRCATCGKEIANRFIVPRERDTIRSLPNSEVECSKCGNRARLEEYPAAFFDLIADRPPFDIDDEVLAWLRSELRYDIQPDVTRFRAFRRVREGYTYLRLSGSLSGLPTEQLAEASGGTTIVDLEQASFDPTDMDKWRNYVRTMMVKITSLQLVHCPPGFLEAGVELSDLHDKLKVRSFACVYDCPRCGTSAAQLIDVAENLEQLAYGAAPQVTCSSCQSMLVPLLTGATIQRMKALPARDRNAALDKLIERARTEPSNKLENVLLLAPKQNKKARSPALVVAVSAAVVALVGIGAVGYLMYKDSTKPAQQAQVAGNLGSNVAGVVVPAPPPKTNDRPDWVLSDIPSSAYCHDMINRLMCVGVSAYRKTRDEGVADATDAALEELVNSVGLKVTDAFFRENFMDAFSDVRSDALSNLQAVDLDRTSKAFLEADEKVTKSRRRVVDVLQASGGAAVPAQRTDWYWEEYEVKGGGGTEFLVFIRYDVTLDAVKSLAEKYSTTTQIADATMMTAFPSLAWRFDEFKGGALVIKPNRAMAEAGLVKFDVIRNIGDQRIGDTVAFNRRLSEWKPATGPLKLDVMSAEKPPRMVELKRLK